MFFLIKVQAEKDAIKAKRAAFMAKANAFSGM